MFPSTILNQAAQALARSHALRMAPHWPLALHTFISFQGPMGRWCNSCVPTTTHSFCPDFLSHHFKGVAPSLTQDISPKNKVISLGVMEKLSGFRLQVLLLMDKSCMGKNAIFTSSSVRSHRPHPGLRDVVHQLQKPLENDEDIPPLEKEIIDSKVI